MPSQRFFRPLSLAVSQHRFFSSLDPASLVGHHPWNSGQCLKPLWGASGGSSSSKRNWVSCPVLLASMNNWGVCHLSSQPTAALNHSYKLLCPNYSSLAPPQTQTFLDIPSLPSSLHPLSCELDWWIGWGCKAVFAERGTLRCKTWCEDHISTYMLWSFCLFSAWWWMAGGGNRRCGSPAAFIRERMLSVQ